MSAAIPAVGALFKTVGAAGLIGGGTAAAGAGIFGGGGLGLLGTVIGGIGAGLSARAEHRASMQRDEAQVQRIRDNYAGAAEGMEQGWWRDPYDGGEATPAAGAFQRVDPMSNQRLPVGQSEMPNRMGSQYSSAATPAGFGQALSQPVTAPQTPRPASGRYQYDRRTGRIEFA